MSATFYRSVLPASWAISQISRLFFRPHTILVKPLRISRYESLKGATKMPEYTRTFLRSSFISTFHARALELLKVQFPDALTITNGPSNTLRIVVAGSQGAETNVAYHQMNDLLQERHVDGSLANITELDLSVPWADSNKSLAHVPVGSGTISTPNLTSFTWSGSLLLLPRPWRTLAQLDFSAVVKLSLTDCELTIQDCLFIFERSPELKEFTAMTISAGITEFGTVPEHAGLQEVVAFRNLSQSYLRTVSDAWPRKPSNIQVQCTKLRFIALSTRVDIKPLWDALGPCNKLKEVHLKATDDSARESFDSIPWGKSSLRTVSISTTHTPEVVDQWNFNSLRRPDTIIEVKSWNE